ncbi:hypothetical protein QQF64_000202 [Cirrhinus molitorella]|uniref:Immunoglobulin V-set domain-containing protein n=1 Tax=Cirrhinus molitorella TaxID=172907 RepID=A0ABR3NWH6_9TELE
MYVHLREMKREFMVVDHETENIFDFHLSATTKIQLKYHGLSSENEGDSDGDSLETIRDDRFSFSDEASTGVFTVNITDLREEDSGIYWCGAHFITKVNLTVKKDFSMIIIISVCVILLLIGGFALTVWKLRHKRRGDAHTHLPTTPSDGLLYAAISFQKHEESLSDAAVRFSKDDIHSDYAAVSHRMRLN